MIFFSKQRILPILFYCREQDNMTEIQHDGFYSRLSGNSPVAAVAIHAGSRIRSELQPYLLADDFLRRSEEDYGTSLLIESCPDIVILDDSRAEYDVNRPRETALPLTADRFWGIQLYREIPPDEINRRTLAKYDYFRHFMAEYTASMVDKFGYCYVFDIHSFNPSRQAEKGLAPVPLFCVGTRNVPPRFRSKADQLIRQIRAIAVPGLTNHTLENCPFSGGDFGRSLVEHDDRVCVFSIETAKYYLDEKTQLIDFGILQNIARELSKIIREWQ